MTKLHIQIIKSLPPPLYYNYVLPSWQTWNFPSCINRCLVSISCTKFISCSRCMCAFSYWCPSYRSTGTLCIYICIFVIHCLATVSKKPPTAWAIVAGLLLTLDHYQPQISLKLRIKYCTLDDKIVGCMRTGICMCTIIMLCMYMWPYIVMYDITCVIIILCHSYIFEACRWKKMYIYSKRKINNPKFNFFQSQLW